MTDEIPKLTKSERRNLEKQSWNGFRNIIKFKNHKRTKTLVTIKGKRYKMLGWAHTERRTKPEKVEVIDQMLRDLGQDPEADV